MIPDMVNGLFELIAGFFLWYNAYKLYRHKKVRGCSVSAAVFFCLWGLWNIFYYPWLGQWWSFAGGVHTDLANLTWVWLAWRYRHN